MDFLEKDLEDILYDNNSDNICMRGLSCFKYDYIERQVDLKQYGIADLITLKKNGKHLHFTVYELKNKVLNPAAFWQTIRYIRGVQDTLSNCNFKNRIISVSGVMIGRSIDLNTDLCFLPSIDSVIDMYTYQYNLYGMTFKRVNNNYTKTNFDGIRLSQFETRSAFDFYKTFLINTIEENVI
jgi:hypothetical protein